MPRLPFWQTSDETKSKSLFKPIVKLFLTHRERERYLMWCFFFLLTLRSWLMKSRVLLIGTFKCPQTINNFFKKCTKEWDARKIRNNIKNVVVKTVFYSKSFWILSSMWKYSQFYMNNWHIKPFTWENKDHWLTIGLSSHLYSVWEIQRNANYKECRMKSIQLQLSHSICLYMFLFCFVFSLVFVSTFMKWWAVYKRSISYNSLNRKFTFRVNIKDLHCL